MRDLVKARYAISAVCGLGALLLAGPQAMAATGGDAHLVIAERTIPAGQIGQAVVPCGPGERAIGGGAGFVSSPATSLVEDGPLSADGHAITNDGGVPRFWYAAVVNNTSAEHHYTFHATCSASSDATVQVESVRIDAAIDSPYIPAYAEKAVPCPGGQRAIGGGTEFQSIAYPGDYRIEQTGPLDETGLTANTEDGDAARWWFGEARNFSPATSPYVSFYALCSPTSAATVQVTSVDLSASTGGGANVYCPEGQEALGGGVVSPTSNEGHLEFLGPIGAAGEKDLGNGDVARGWATQVDHFGAGTASFKFSAMCTPISPPPPVPPASGTATPSSTDKRAAALKKCKKKHSKKARKKCRRKAARLPA